MNPERVRVLVVDDTVVYRKIISDLLSAAPGVEVVGVASNGRIALQKCAQVRPDLLTLDVEMPEIDGLEVLRRLRDDGSPIGAIMLSAFTTQGADATIQALKFGAFDFVVKPTSANAAENAAVLRSDLLARIQAFARAHRTLTALKSAPAPRLAAPPASASVAQRMQRLAAPAAAKPRVVAIGDSTGGPAALAQMLPRLPANLASPVRIVQHMPPIFTRSLADGLNDKCARTVREAVEGEPVATGTVLIAPGGKQMKVERVNADVVVRLTADPPENSCRPSVDYLFRSVAQTYGGFALAVVMTGMGSDGAAGCRTLKQRGATVLTQDEATCVVYGMPKAPADEGLSDVIAPLDGIAAEITRLVGKEALACK